MKSNKIYILCMVAFLLIYMTGCQSESVPNSENTKEIDIVLLSGGLHDTLDSSGQIDQVDTSMVETIYAVQKNDVTSCIVYMSTGATADEIAVFECKSAEAAQRLEKVLEARRKDEINVFKDYAPEEVAKLEDAIIMQKDRYAVYCVTPDTKKAKEVIDSYF